MCYKIYYNLVDLPFHSFFTRPVSISGHSCILRSKCLPHHTFRAHFFTEHVIPIRNHLPQDVISSLKFFVPDSCWPFILLCFVSLFVDLKEVCKRMYHTITCLLMYIHVCVHCLRYEEYWGWSNDKCNVFNHFAPVFTNDNGTCFTHLLFKSILHVI